MLYHHVLQKEPDILEEHIASIFRSKNKSRKKPEEAYDKLNCWLLA
jgi:hypothetical protein